MLKLFSGCRWSVVSGSHIRFENLEVAFCQICNNAVTTRLWLNNVVHYCFNNVVQHWWSYNGCSRLLKQEKTISTERQACSLLLSLLLNLVNKLLQYWWLFVWLNNLADNIVNWMQHNIVHSWQYNIVHSWQHNIVHACWQLGTDCAFLRVCCIRNIR